MLVICCPLQRRSENTKGAEDAESPFQPETQRRTVTRSEGSTASEKYLNRLCGRSFLSLWSYPVCFVTKVVRMGKGMARKSVLLVVFENYIIIFSDKDIQLDDGDDIEVAWADGTGRQF